MTADREVFPSFKEPAKPKASRVSQLRVWSLAVRKRDGYRCQFPDCGRFDKTNHAHHLATKKQRPDLWLEVSNGITLCLEHHHWVHAHPVEAELMELVNRERYENR